MYAELSDPAPSHTSVHPAASDYINSMERLLRAVQELSLARSLADIQRIVRTSARELTGCDGATFVLRDQDKCYYADEEAIAAPDISEFGGWRAYLQAREFAAQ